MTALVETYDLVDIDTLSNQRAYEEAASIAQLSAKQVLNQEVMTGDYNGNVVYGLGKTALNTNHWLGLVRAWGFHVFVTDMQNIRGCYLDSIAQQLDLAGKLVEDNPLFTNTLKSDEEQTSQMMSSGYLFTGSNGIRVVDYLLLSCPDRITHKRMTLHPDRVNEHVDPFVRDHTIQIARTIINIS